MDELAGCIHELHSEGLVPWRVEEKLEGLSAKEIHHRASSYRGQHLAWRITLSGLTLLGEIIKVYPISKQILPHLLYFKFPF